MVDANNAPVALVTGARKGIGRHLAEHLLKQGYLVIGCSRNPAGWEKVGFDHRQVDVTDEEQVELLLHHIRKRYGRLDVLINNAGVASMNHVLLTPLSTAERIVDTNVFGTFLASREAAKLMVKRRFGRIVNFSSIAVPMHLAGEALYVASKCAVVGLSQVMAHELAEFGITVNVVGPGPIPTDLIRGVPKENVDRIIESLAIKRLTTFEDLTNVVDFFLRPESSAITGQVIYLGGMPNV
jgi:3-oxoacyl-[acyl-carrier protein] reductase